MLPLFWRGRGERLKIKVQTKNSKIKMNTQTINKEMSDKINFMTFIITKFARAYKMNSQQAYLYLKKYGGLDFLNDCWWALHTEDPYWSIKSLYQMCYNNGGVK